MKRLTILLGLLLSLHAGAQEHAVVVCDEETFTMQSVAAGTLQVKRVVTVNDEHGLGEATFSVLTNQSEALSAFKGTLDLPGGKSLKIKKSDLQTVAIGSGLAEDGYLTGYVPSGRYPFTVTYEYSVQHRNGFAVFPAYSPVRTEKTRLQHGSYTLVVPAGTRVNYHATGFDAPRTNATTFVWTLDDYAGFTEEHLMPDVRAVVPHVQASPEEFMYDGFSGQQYSWEALGYWLNELLAGTDDLPTERIDEIAALTADCKTNLEKVKIVYDYLCNKTRYVSIQYGIGGFRPFPCSSVDKTGYGDCKALSNYFRCLLQAAGVESVYTVLNTRQAHPYPGYCSIGQHDHVMVAVPLKETGDTLLVECTHRLPLGYRPGHVAGHDILLVTPHGGRMTAVPGYADSLRRTDIRAAVQLREDGSAHVTVTDEYHLDLVESWLEFRNWDADKQKNRLTAGIGFQPQDLAVTSVEDNFNSYDGEASWCPVLKIGYEMDSRTFSRVTGTRLFIPVNLFAKRLYIQRSDRINPLQNKEGHCSHDVVTYQLPAGYKVESIPQPVRLDEGWGSFTSDITIGDGTVTVDQFLHLKAFDADRSRYPDYRSFARTLNKAFDASIVLVAE